MTTSTYKVVLTGPTKVGKTTYLHRFLNGQFITNHTPTLGYEVHPLHFTTNYGNVTVNIWDCAGDDNFGGLRDAYYIKADGAIAMADLTRPDLALQANPWLRDLYHICPDIPVVVCGNKVDCKDREIFAGEISSWLCSGPSQRGVRYYDISARSNYNFEKPFFDLVRRLRQHPDLVFIENPAIPTIRP